MAAKRKRNYRHEYDSYHGTPEQKKRRAARGRSRYKMEKEGKVGKGQDVHHKDRNPNNTSSSNLKAESKKKNRGWRKGKH